MVPVVITLNKKKIRKFLGQKVHPTKDLEMMSLVCFIFGDDVSRLSILLEMMSLIPSFWPLELLFLKKDVYIPQYFYPKKKSSYHASRHRVTFHFIKE